MARLSKLTPADRLHIRRIVGNLHVSSTDTHVLNELRTRYAPKVRYMVTPGYIKQAEAYALAEHHRNQDVFRFYRF